MLRIKYLYANIMFTNAASFVGGKWKEWVMQIKSLIDITVEEALEEHANKDLKGIGLNDWKV